MNASLVVPHLWVGSIPLPGDNVCRRGFDRLLILAQGDICYADAYPGVATFHVPLQDHVCTAGEEAKAIQLGRIVASWVRRQMNVFVACERGLNRAALVGSIALIARGTPAIEAMQKVKAARGSMALDGPHFQRLLQRLEDTWSFQRPFVTA
jgi:protein-tyrosine phosphatase